MVNILFVGKTEGEFYKRLGSRGKDIAIDVSGYAGMPFKLLSPYTYDPNMELPVPGIPERSSYSVEGVWQGLKIVNGEIDESYFTHRPKKRKGCNPD